MNAKIACLTPSSSSRTIGVKQQDSLVWNVRENGKNASHANIANPAKISEESPGYLPIRPDRLLSLQQVRDRLAGKSKSWIYNQIAQGKFPKQRKLGTTAVWSENEINAYISSILKGKGGDNV